MPILINGTGGSAGGSGDGSILMVNLNETYPYSVDKTFAEIYAAYNAGRPVVAVSNVDSKLFYLRAMYSTSAEFTSVVTGSVEHKIYSVHSDNTVSLSWQSPLGRGDYVTQPNTLYGSPMARAIYAGISDMVSGSTSLTNGTIYLQYDE